MAQRKYADRLQRPEWHKWYHLPRWERLRKLHFAGEHMQPDGTKLPGGLCVMCNESGFVVAAEVCDHIKPPRGNPDLFWDSTNLQGLCLMHHNSHKQQIEKGNKGYTREIDATGWPADVNHPVNVAERKQQERLKKTIEGRARDTKRR